MAVMREATANEKQFPLARCELGRGKKDERLWSMNGDLG